MKKLLIKFFLIQSLLIICNFVKAQEDRTLRDSTRTGTDTSQRGRGMSSLFADSTQLTAGDYQLQIEKTYVTLNRIEKESVPGRQILDIRDNLAEIDNALLAIGDNLGRNDKTLNLRNLQMYATLLEHMHTDLAAQRALLDSTENHLADLKNDMRALRKDTVFIQLMRDSAVKVQFAAQLKTLRSEWRSSRRHLKQSLDSLQQLQTHNSRNAINAFALLEKTNNLLATSRQKIFGKEYTYLWERTPDTATEDLSKEMRKTYSSERKALRYYFKDSGSRRILLLFISLLFFAWIYRNIYRIKKMNLLHKISALKIEYIYPSFILSFFIVMFSIGPLFDLDAPAVYVEMMQFFLLVSITVLCWKKWPRPLFLCWIAMAVLFICFSFTHTILLPGLYQRLFLIILNLASVIFGYLFLLRSREQIRLMGFLRFVVILHNAMNIAAIICNVLGRFSLAQILGSTAIFAFTQIIGLGIFSKIFIEAIVLQIETSRLKQGIQTAFDFSQVRKGFQRPVLLVVALIWLIVFTTNLNIYSSLLNQLTILLSTSRSIGSAGFTIGGVLLFFCIIWIAHLLQKYVSYFFGATGDDEQEQNKEQRSKMLIARLIVLSVGYLLAVGASGLPLDKITIILGALSVGIGLGLQNIVSNLVSGIILIFDRPLQIGDIVEMDKVSGRVKEIGLRSSTLLTQDGAEIIIPNGDILSQKITNWTLSNNQQRLEIALTVTGCKDREKIAAIVKETIFSSRFILEKKEPQLLVTAMDKDTLGLKILFWCAEVSKSEEVKSEILFLLHENFRAQNIIIK